MFDEQNTVIYKKTKKRKPAPGGTGNRSAYARRDTLDSHSYCTPKGTAMQQKKFVLRLLFLYPKFICDRGFLLTAL